MSFLVCGAFYLDKAPREMTYISMDNLTIDRLVFSNNLDKLYYQLDIFNNQFLRSKNNYQIQSVINSYGIDLYDLKKAINRRQRKKDTLRKNMNKLFNISNTLIFGTITFNNDSIDLKNKRLLVKKFLDKHNALYICNVDYGKKNNRIHYHVVINKELDPYLWKYGSINFKRIIKSDNNLSLRNYLTKLNRHAMKDTTISNERIIYKLK